MGLIIESSARAAQRAHAAHVLARADLTGLGPVAELPGGINGSIRVFDVPDPAGGEAVRALLKLRGQGGVHEVFAHRVAEASGIDQLLAVTAPYGDGDALIEFVPGQS